MSKARRSKVDDSAARTALLDAAEALMVEEGYAAVTTRRVATRAGVNNGLVYYYFGTMDELFVALFRRSVSEAGQAGVLAPDDPQPLWAMWEGIRDFRQHALIQEFIALANHREPVHAELTTYWAQSRTAEVAYLRSVLEAHGVDLDAWPPASLLLLMVGTTRFMLMEQAFAVDDGHAETVALIERHITGLEGPRVRH
ncbi:MAG: helix-turn-helix domain-containing protein [Acidimicrobiia bacterium]